MRHLITLTFLFGIATFKAALALDESEIFCPVTTPILGQPPKDINADPFLKSKWFVNSDKTLWAGWDAANLRVGRNKVLWIKPNGEEITVEAIYLSDQSKVVADLASGYVTTFQPSILQLEKPGCLKISAFSNGNSLEFLTMVTK